MTMYSNLPLVRVVILSALFVYGCGEDIALDEPWRLAETAAMNCGAGNSDFERSTWEHQANVSRLSLEMAEGCAVYRAELTFADVWTTRTEICNRCDESRHLVCPEYGRRRGNQSRRGHRYRCFRRP